MGPYTWLEHLHVVDKAGAEVDAVGQAARALKVPFEVHSSWADLLHAQPVEGIILASDRHLSLSAAEMRQGLLNHSVPLPFILYSKEPAPYDIFSAGSGGAIDFLVGAISEDSLGHCLLRCKGACASETARYSRIVEARERIDGLTPRQKEYFFALNLGMKNSEIAAVMNISPRTAEIHRQSMLKKLDVADVIQAIELHRQAEFEI